MPLVGVWSLRQPPDKALQRQVRYLRLMLKDGSADELNLVGFVNYIIGSTDVNTVAEAAGGLGDRRGPEPRRTPAIWSRARCP